MIALTLTAILLTFLFSFFTESAKTEKKLDAARLAVESRGYLQTRLQTVLGAIDHNATEALYTKRFEKEPVPSLIAVFDNGIDPEPAFSGFITGRIFLDSEKNLCLAVWPLGTKENRPWRKEILLPHVENFEFEFLGKRSASEHGKKEKMRPINPMLAWRSSWPKSETEIPSIILLHIKEEKQATLLQFAFILPVAEPLVTYIGKG